MHTRREIILVRHGQPQTSALPLTGFEIGNWGREYDKCEIDGQLPPPKGLRELTQSVACVLASDRLRSQVSASWLRPQGDIQIDSELREAPLPESIDVSIRLSPGAWVVIARLVWWFNLRRSEESIQEVRLRAARVADRLTRRAEECGSLMVVGHGMFNRFVASQLRRRGWVGPRLLPRGYWASARFLRSPRIRSTESSRMLNEHTTKPNRPRR